MRKSAVLAALSLLLVGGSGSFADAPKAEVGGLGARIIAAINSGDDLASMNILHSYLKFDPARVRSLRGCESRVLPATRTTELHVDWVCANTDNSAFVRIYLSDNKISRIEFQPSLSLMHPTPAGSALSQIPARSEIRRLFQDAVVSGTDPTLNGLIPISSDQVAELHKLKGWAVISQKDSGEYGSESLWFDRRNGADYSVDTTIHFDSAGRPIGFWLRISSIIVVAEMRPH